MKKRVMICALTLLLCGCGADAALDTFTAGAPIAPKTVQEGAKADAEDDLYGVYEDIGEDAELRMILQQSAYPPDADIITVQIINARKDGFFIPADEFRLYRVFNGQAQTVPYKDGGDCFIETAQEIPADSTTEHAVQLAAHYDLPLEEGRYRIEIPGWWDGAEGKLTADFECRADAEMPAAEQPMVFSVKEKQYAADAAEIELDMMNLSDEPLTLDLSEFGLEAYGDGCVSMTWYRGSGTVTVPPQETQTITLLAADFGITEWTPGRYSIVCRNGREPFRIGE